MSNRREHLATAHLYLVCAERSDDFLAAALRGGVDIVQLRMKDASDQAVLTVGRRFARICAAYGALFIVNDRPDLALAAGADGVHVGQDDMAPARVREVVGGELLVGLSTHTPEQISAAAATDADYIGVGPVYETPTKPGRQAVGVELVSHAARHATLPFFAIGGVSRANLPAVREAGARRVAVVRALTEASEPESVAVALRQALATQEVPLGTT